MVTMTRRKVKVIGVQEYINTKTGQVEQFQVMRIEERDANFDKLWLGHVLAAVDEIGNAKMRILMYLIANRDPLTNMVVKTTKEIVEETGTSHATVVTTIKKLLAHDIVRRKPGTKGILFLNPNVVFKGSTSGRLKVLIEYSRLPASSSSPPLVE